jgi:hypothetical protein
MRLKHLLFLTLFALLLFNFAKAQTTGGKISGSILDASKKPLDGATVVLLTAKDSTEVSKQLANPDGSFTFQSLKDNTYILKATYIGYKDYRSDNVVVSQQKPVNLSPFTLSSIGKALNELAINVKK